MFTFLKLCNVYKVAVIVITMKFNYSSKSAKLFKLPNKHETVTVLINIDVSKQFTLTKNSILQWNAYFSHPFFISLKHIYSRKKAWTTSWVCSSPLLAFLFLQPDHFLLFLSVYLWFLPSKYLKRLIAGAFVPDVFLAFNIF